jgi:hypothetical protein
MVIHLLMPSIQSIYDKTFRMLIPRANWYLHMFGSNSVRRYELIMWHGERWLTAPLDFRVTDHCTFVDSFYKGYMGEATISLWRDHHSLEYVTLTNRCTKWLWHRPSHLTVITYTHTSLIK